MIPQHDEREFVLKFSAMEIYNEAVRDLLGADASPLRLLDDPEVEFSLMLISGNSVCVCVCFVTLLFL